MKIVVIGGGTGLSRLLRAFKYIKDIKLSAIVTISDDGGSTGMLSRKFKIPAVGDIRRVIGALSTEREFLERTLEFRFKDTNSLFDGHSLGNIIILSEILRTGSFSQGIIDTCKMLNTKGKIIPVANYQNALFAEFEDGSVLEGESSFHQNDLKIKKVFFKDKNIKAHKKAIKEIMDADFVVLGIGSLYTSILPNLIYPNMIKALKNTSAKIVYFGNISTEKGETDNMTLMDHITAIENHTFKGVVDEVVINSTPISDEIKSRYHQNGQEIIKNDVSKDYVNITKAPLLVFEEGIIRHSPELLQKTFEKLLRRYDI